eukprot:Selendium_serpulae@DN11899_c0_g1_i1.p1
MPISENNTQFGTRERKQVCGTDAGRKSGKTAKLFKATNLCVTPIGGLSEGDNKNESLDHAHATIARSRKRRLRQNVDFLSLFSDMDAFVDGEQKPIEAHLVPFDQSFHNLGKHRGILSARDSQCDAFAAIGQILILFRFVNVLS